MDKRYAELAWPIETPDFQFDAGGLAAAVVRVFADELGISGWIEDDDVRLFVTATGDVFGPGEPEEHASAKLLDVVSGVIHGAEDMRDLQGLRVLENSLALAMGRCQAAIERQSK